MMSSGYQKAIRNRQSRINLEVNVSNFASNTVSADDLTQLRATPYAGTMVTKIGCHILDRTKTVNTRHIVEYCKTCGLITQSSW